MIKVSKEFKEYMARDKRKFLVRADIILKDGEMLEQLDDSDFWENGVKLEDGVTPGNQFAIGSCIINKLTLTLNNIYDKFSPYDFGSAVVKLQLGMKLADKQEEWIDKGIFIVDEPSYDGTTITLECLDYMSRFDVDYLQVETEYPATLEKIVEDICEYCGITFASADFPNCDYEVEERPDDEKLTCRQMISYCAQLAGCFGRCSRNGDLEFGWFQNRIFENKDSRDGGIFDEGVPEYRTGDSADGGDFNEYSRKGSIDGGNFEEMNDYHHIFSLNSFKTSTDDVIITGVRVIEEFPETETEKKQMVLVGEEGYVLEVSGNKLIQKGKGREAARFLGKRLNGLRFRPMSAQALSDPTVEAGDIAYVTDWRQNTYNCLITNLKFNLGGFMDISCDAETPGKNSSKQYSELTRAVVEAKKETLNTIRAAGHYESNNRADESSVDIYNGKITFTDSKGTWSRVEPIEDGMRINTPKLEIGNGINHYKAQTGTVRFSDGSYLKFVNGILVGGRMAEPDEPVEKE